MTDNLYKTFVTATYQVFNLMLDLSDITDRPVETFLCDDELDISIGVVGDLHGEVIYRFPFATSLSMVNIMIGMQVEAVDDFVTSAISEIANIISGNVLTALAGNNQICDILPPVQCKPDESREYELSTSRCISTSIGEVCLDIRLNQA
jgi:chemotaxis protein CheX